MKLHPNLLSKLDLYTITDTCYFRRFLFCLVYTQGGVEYNEKYNSHFLLNSSVRGWNEDPCIRPTMHQISSILDTVLRILLSPDRELPSLQIPSHLPQHEAPLFSDTCNPEPLGPHFINEVCWQLPFGTCFFSPNIL